MARISVAPQHQRNNARQQREMAWRIETSGMAKIIMVNAFGV